MVQEIIVERLMREGEGENAGKYCIILSSMGIDGVNGKECGLSDIVNKKKGQLFQLGAHKPHIAISVNTKVGQPVSASLTITNPDKSVARSLYKRKFRVWCGYSWATQTKNGELITSYTFSNVFTGEAYTDATTETHGIDTSINIPLNLFGGRDAGAKLLSEKQIEKAKIGDFLKEVLPSEVNASEDEATNELKAQELTKDLFWNESYGIPEIEQVLASQGIDFELSGMKYFLRKNGEAPTKNATKNNTFIIFNDQISETKLAPTMLKSRYSAIGLSGLFTIQLALPIPEAMTYQYFSIENLGTNFEIFAQNSMRKKHETGGGLFQANEQNFSFDTFGAGDHSINLLAYT